MDVRLLVIEDCPNAAAAAALLRRALDDVGLAPVPIHTQVVTEPEEAERLGFGGSPTILIDGRDPFAEPDRPPALACRVYRTEAGPAGVPELAPLRQALEQATHPGR